MDRELKLQSDKFKEAARELEADESVERFEATVRRIASAPKREPKEPKK